MSNAKYVVSSRTTSFDIFKGVFLALVLFDLLGRLW